MLKGSHNCLALQQQRVATAATSSEPRDFLDLLNSPQLLNIIENELPQFRQRVYPPTTTLALFIAQMLGPDSSCQHVVNAHATERVSNQLPRCSTKTSGYCRARQRLPTHMVSSLVKESGKMICKSAPSEWLCDGRPVKLLDGSTLSMPDTPDNQASYPQQRAQLPGLGFPIARLVVVVCLATGAVIDAAIGPNKGKATGELALLMSLLESFEPGDIVIADRLYCNYMVIALLQARGVDVVMRQHGRRRTDYRCGKQLGVRDHIVDWHRPKNSRLTDVTELPEQLCLRELSVGGQTLVTTLREPKQMPKKRLGELYKQRWQVELILRDIKTTLGMESLDCKTAKMNEKQMWVYLLGYNLIRLIMAQAAVTSSLLPCQLSFKHSVQLWVVWSQRYGFTHKQGFVSTLLEMIAENTVGNRAGRVEPRARKKRPKQYALLLIPREQARIKIRKSGHPQKIR